MWIITDGIIAQVPNLLYNINPIPHIHPVINIHFPDGNIFSFNVSNLYNMFMDIIYHGLGPNVFNI
jgi:hypothetical protein